MAAPNFIAVDLRMGNAVEFHPTNCIYPQFCGCVVGRKKETRELHDKIVRSMHALLPNNKKLYPHIHRNMIIQPTLDVRGVRQMFRSRI